MFDPHGLAQTPIGIKLFDQKDDETNDEFEKRLTTWLVKNKNYRVYARDVWGTIDKKWRMILWYSKTNVPI